MYLMYPKTRWKKKRKKHPGSLVAASKGICLLCVKLHNDYSEKYTEKHHVFFGSGRRNTSEQNGFVCNLCLAHRREGPEAVHQNRETREKLCRIFQEEYEKSHTRKEFVELIGKNYLDEE